MKKEKPIDELKKMILQAEQKRYRLEEEIKDDVKAYIESFKPANLLKKGFNTLTHSDHLKENAVKGGVGVLAAFVFKKLLFKRVKQGLVRGLLGFALQKGASYLFEHKDEIREKAAIMLDKFKGNKKEDLQEVW